MKKLFILILLLCSLAYGDTQVVDDLHLESDEARIYFYNGDYFLTFQASATLASNYGFTWMINDGDPNSVIYTPDGAGTLAWGAGGDVNNVFILNPDPNWIEPNDLSFDFEPGSIIFASANGSLWEDNDNLYFNNASDFVGIGTSSPNAGIQVVRWINFEPTLENTQAGEDAGDALTAGSRNSFGAFHAGYYQDSNDSTAWGYRAGGGGVGLFEDEAGDWNEAHIITANNYIDILDSDMAIVDHNGFGGGGSMTLDIHPNNGEVVAGSINDILRREPNGVWSSTYYVPTGGWSDPVTMDVVRGLRYTDDGDYLYCTIEDPGMTSHTYVFKFAVATGVEEWNVMAMHWGTYCLGAVDSSDNVYIPVTYYPSEGQAVGGIRKINSDGTIGADWDATQRRSCGYDVWIDETNDMLLAVGNTLTAGTYPFVQILCFTFSTGMIDWAKTLPASDRDNEQIYSVKTRPGIDDYIYACGSNMDISGGSASVFKLDFDGNLIDSYDTGANTSHLWFDGDNNLIVLGSSTDDEIYKLDPDDMSLIDNANLDVLGLYGAEGRYFPSVYERVERPFVADRFTAVGSYALGSLINNGDGITGVGYGAGRRATIASNSLYLGANSGSRQTTTPNVLVVDTYDRQSALSEASSSLMYGRFNVDPTLQTLAINAAMTVRNASAVTYTLNDGLDGDITIVLASVTGFPEILWDESADEFVFNKGITLTSLTTASITISTLASGSIPYAGANGELLDDQPYLYWDYPENRMGLGTASPTTALHVMGRITTSSLTTASLTVTRLASGTIPYVGANGEILDDASNLYYDYVENRMGLGTASPAAPLAIKADTANKVMRIIEAGAGTEYWDVEILPSGNLLYKNDAGNPALMLEDALGRVTIGSDSVIEAKLNIVGGANAELFRFKTTSTWLSLLPYTDDGMHWAENIVNNVTNGNLIFTHWNNRAKDHDHSTLQTDPTIIIHSSTDPDTSNVEWGSFQFKGTGSGGGYWYFETGVGDISLSPVGNVLIGTTDSGTGSPAGILTLASGTHPTAPAADTACLFVEDPGTGYAEMRVMNSNADETTLSPHNFSLFDPNDDYELPWSYYSKNAFVGKEINVDMYGAIKAIENITGKKFIYVKDIAKTDWREHQEELQRQRQLNEEVEITLAEAIEEYEITEPNIVGYDSQYSLDPDTGTIVETQVPITADLPTGKFAKRLKTGIRLDEETGKLYRKKQNEEVIIDPTKFTQLPEWMKKRTQLIR